MNHLVPELDVWIRRRVRMCYWKQWRWARTKIRHLLDLGVSLQTAIQHAVSSKSYWHMARTPALQQALSDAEPARLVEGAGLGQRQRLVVQSSGQYHLMNGNAVVKRANLLNRALQTRMVGVGAGS